MHLKLKHPELAQQVQTSKKESQKHSNHSHHPHHANHLNHSLSSSSSPGTSNYLSYFPIQNTNVSSNPSSSSKPCTGRLFEILQQSNHIDGTFLYFYYLLLKTFLKTKNQIPQAHGLLKEDSQSQTPLL